MNKMNYWTTYSIIGVLVVVGALFASFVYQHNQQVKEASKDEADGLALVEESSSTVAKNDQVANAEVTNDTENSFSNIEPMKIAEVEVQASVARSWADRIKGLSGTPELPEGLVKLFVFDTSGLHSIWMKDMNYSIDIIWADENNSIVYIEENVSPDTYPDSFTTDVPAKYVIETRAGFVETNKIKVGDSVTIPKKRF